MVVENVIVLYIEDGKSKSNKIEDYLEFCHLIEALEKNLLFFCFSRLRVINSATYVSSGVIEYLLFVLSKLKCNKIIINKELSAPHQRNLEKLLCIDIVDRTELLLQLFAVRAQSFAGKLQVELASLTYMSTKLVRGWTHLERQRGGIGLRGGPGEKQIEVDRRILRARMLKTKNKIDKLCKTRDINRKKRSSEYTVALVGYTSAGKSQLFNRLTGSGTLVSSKLFATLDPLTRRIPKKEIGLSKDILLVDTVGFIKELPRPLITAFKATLEELLYADIILHVVDSSCIDCERKVSVVDAYVQEIVGSKIPCLRVYNKIDLLDDVSYQRIDLSSVDFEISALYGKGIAELNSYLYNYFEQCG